MARPFEQEKFVYPSIHFSDEYRSFKQKFLNIRSEKEARQLIKTTLPFPQKTLPKHFQNLYESQVLVNYADLERKLWNLPSFFEIPLSCFDARPVSWVNPTPAQIFKWKLPSQDIDERMDDAFTQGKFSDLEGQHCNIKIVTYTDKSRKCLQQVELFGHVNSVKDPYAFIRSKGALINNVRCRMPPKCLWVSICLYPKLNTLPFKIQYFAVEHAVENFSHLLFPTFKADSKPLVSKEHAMQILETLKPELSTNQKLVCCGVVSETREECPSLIQGPVGAGKTFVGSATVRILCKRGLRVSVVCQSNSAATRFYEELAKHANSDMLVLRVVSNECNLSNNIPESKYNKVIIADEESAIWINEAHVVVTTPIASAKLPLSKGQLKMFHVVIWDEVSLVTMIEFMVSLIALRKDGRLILLGDDMQLGAIVTMPVHEKCTLSPYHSYLPHIESFDKSLLFYQLNQNWRSHSSMVQPTSTLFYGGRLESTKFAQENDRQWRAKLDLPSWLEGHNFCVVLKDTQEELVDTTFSFKNKGELAMLQTIVQHMTKKLHIKSNDICVLSFYKEQVDRAQLMFPNITCSSVDGFQGNEKPVVLMSTVRTSSSLAFMEENRRLNVCTSRAKSIMIVVCSDYIIAKSTFWSNYTSRYCSQIPKENFSQTFNSK